jgi:Family of unknown function (DUF6069)
MAIAAGRIRRSTDITHRALMIASTILAALAVNLLLYAVGRARGGQFTYAQNGAATTVDPLAITIMTVLPLATGLSLVAWLSPKWPALLTIAKLVAPVVAIGTIGLMTIPAHFDTTSTLFLATMHLALIPATLLALGSLSRQPKQARRWRRV